MTARTSSMRCSSVGASATGSDSPEPRLSKLMTRANDAKPSRKCRAGSCSQRSSIGGTWDLFRYPGVRSDSDMYTLGFRFRPWPDAKAIADGPAILSYVRETASKYGIDRETRFNHRVVRAEWATQDAQWTVEA